MGKMPDIINYRKSRMIDLFTKHPRSMGESYTQHLMCAFKFGSRMVIGGMFCLIHAIFPFIFKKTGSNMLFSLLHDYIDRSPIVEERVMVLSKTIEKKIQQ